MSIYLNYRLKKAGIYSLKTVFIVSSLPNWAFIDVSTELLHIFPGVTIKTSEHEINSNTYDLALILFSDPSYSPSSLAIEVKKVISIKPSYIGLYEMKKRHLIVFPKKFSYLVVLRLRFEFIFKSVMLFPSRVKNKIIRILKNK